MNGFAIALGVMVLMAMPAAPHHAAAAQGAVPAVVKERQATMKDIGKNFGAIKAYIEDGKGTPQDVARHAQTINALPKKIQHLFPEDTGRGKLDAKATRPLPSIRQNWSKFEATSKTLAKETPELARDATGGDKEWTGIQFGPTGKQGAD